MTILSLIKIFIIILPGVFFARKQLLDDRQCEGLSSIVVNLAWPCLVIDALQMDFSVMLLCNAGILAVAFVAVFVLAWVVGLGLSKMIKSDKSLTYLLIYMLVFSNTGFMGIPVCEALYGSEGVFYAALMDSLSDVFVFTAGTFLIKQSTGVSVKNHPKELLTPGLASIVIGLTLFLLDIRLPELLGDTLATIGGMTTPLAMFIIGYKLGKMGLSNMLGDRKAYQVSFARLVVVPVLVLLILVAFQVELTVLMKVIALQCAMPVATCTVIFVEQYKGNTDFASRSVLLSTVFSVVTLPLFALALEWLA